MPFVPLDVACVSSECVCVSVFGETVVQWEDFSLRPLRDNTRNGHTTNIDNNKCTQRHVHGREVCCVVLSLCCIVVVVVVVSLRVCVCECV